MKSLLKCAILWNKFWKNYTYKYFYDFEMDNASISPFLPNIFLCQTNPLYLLLHCIHYFSLLSSSFRHPGSFTFKILCI